MDSLGVGTIEIGCPITPNCQQHRQEAPKCCLTMLGSFLHFFGQVSAEEGAFVPPLFVPTCPTGLGGLIGQEPCLCHQEISSPGFQG